MPSSRRLLVLGSVAAVGFLGAVWCLSGSSPQVDRAPLPSYPEAVESRSNLADASNARLLVVSPEASLLVFEDAVNRGDIGGVKLIPVTSRRTRTIDVIGDGFETLESVGVGFPLQELESGTWLAYRSGYVPCVIERPTVASRVPLVPATTIDVHVEDEQSNPVRETVVALFPERVTSPVAVRDEHRVGVGDPRSSEPVWIGMTDGRGFCRFDTVPKGHYRLRVWHRFCYASSGEGAGRVSIESPATVFVAMEELFAVCVVAPPGRAILRHYWKKPDPLDLSIEVVKGRTVAKRYLAETFPSAVAYVGRPRRVRPGMQSMIECYAFLDGPQMAKLRWPLARVRDIQDPVVLEVDNSAIVRDLCVRVVDAYGNEMSLNLRLVESDRKTVHRVRSGERVAVLEGRYKVIPISSPVWVEEQFDEAFVNVGASDALVVEKRVVLTERFRLLRIVPKWTGEFVGVVHIAIDNEAGEGTSVVNWEPERGDIECLMPLGRAMIRFESLAYADQALEIPIPAEGKGPIERQVQLERVYVEARPNGRK